MLDPTKRAAKFSDPTGDLVNSDGVAVDGPNYLDIVAVEIGNDGGELRAILTLDGIPPTGLDGNVEPINFVILIQADGGTTG